MQLSEACSWTWQRQGGALQTHSCGKQTRWAKIWRAQVLLNSLSGLAINDVHCLLYKIAWRVQDEMFPGRIQLTNWIGLVCWTHTLIASKMLCEICILDAAWLHQVLHKSQQWPAGALEAVRACRAAGLKTAVVSSALRSKVCCWHAPLSVLIYAYSC